MKLLIKDEKLARLIYVPPFKADAGQIYSRYGVPVTEFVLLDEGETLQEACEQMNRE